MALLLAVPSACYAWPGKVIHVADGDTISVERNGKVVKIRLYGIDTPEKSQWYGQNAKAFTSAQVMGKIVDIEKIDIDRYRRVVGIVTIGNLVLNRHLLKYGYAWVYYRYCNKPFCSEWTMIEAEARKAKRRKGGFGRIRRSYHHGNIVTQRKRNHPLPLPQKVNLLDQLQIANARETVTIVPISKRKDKPRNVMIITGR